MCYVWVFAYWKIYLSYSVEFLNAGCILGDYHLNAMVVGPRPQAALTFLPSGFIFENTLFTRKKTPFKCRTDLVLNVSAGSNYFLLLFQSNLRTKNYCSDMNSFIMAT